MTTGRLDSKELRHLKDLETVGTHADGKGLYLRVRAAGQGFWTVKFGTTERSLGAADLISVDQARLKHQAMRIEKHEGRDPWVLLAAKAIPARAGEAAYAPTAAAPVPTIALVPANRKRFADVLEAYLALNAPTWKASSRDINSAKYYRLLKTPLAKLWVDAITTADIVTAFEAYTDGQKESHRARVLKVLDYAAAKGFRDGALPNPAAKNILKHLIPAAPKSTPHAALPSEHVPALMARLVADNSPAARALAVVILTALRSGEVRGARWEEIDGNVWHVSAERMKEGVAHDVPLSKVTLALLGKPLKAGPVFADVAERAMATKLKAYTTAKASVHGFRACFSGDWAAKAGYSLELRERALAHKIGGDVASRYNRDTLLAQRAEMMQRWSDYATA
jgi:integrase